MPTTEVVTADDERLATDAEALATDLLVRAGADQRRRERRQSRRVARLLGDPDGLAFVLALTDQVLRIRDPRRAARRLRDLVQDLRRPRFLGPLDQLALQVGARAAGSFPRLVMPLVNGRVRAELAGYVRPAESGPLSRHIARRRQDGFRLNLNLLGEAIVGDDEAERRLAAVETLLRRPDVDHVSIKISSVCAQIMPLAFDAEVERIADRVRRLYDVALAATPNKMVNLDMEEYRDLHLTVAVFRRLLDEPRYAALDAGIVLQAYLPDTLGVLDDLLAWADARHARHGGRTRIRFVKGANLQMERVVAEVAGWPQAPFATKAEVDAHYKRLLDRALVPQHAAAIRVGVATHNLFEAAWALTVARDRGMVDAVELEMLEGMAPATARAARDEAGGVLLYAPIVHRRDHESAIAYLVRRFDENTGPDNYLRHQFAMAPGSPVWLAERARFRQSVADRHLVPATTHMVQDRAHPAAGTTAESARGATGSGNGSGPAGSHNEADTDWALAANRAWLAPHLGSLADLGVGLVTAMVGGRVINSEEPGVAVADGFDPAEPDTPAYRWIQVGPALIDEAATSVAGAGVRWRATPSSERQATLRRVADELAARRGRLIGVMARDGGKTVVEGDAEVSEAVDFARYYAAGIESVAARGAAIGATFAPYRTVAVVPPWNFPLAIPAGGVLAALAAGAGVLLKPAPETVATAAALAEACWGAGVPRDLLQLVPCADGDAGRRLITHPGVDAVILTGSWDTAQTFLGWRPDLALHAETSGKNAMVVTATADLDLAVADLVRSAFGHAGQKCSAASLAIVEAPVYDDLRWRAQLADAVRTLRPGPGWDLRTTIGPVIRPPEGPLADALAHLQPGEEWLVAPGFVGGHPQLVSPGVKLGVAPGSPFHLTECFGPVLGIMRAASLAQAVEWQNATEYGLTAGLHSLDPREIAYWEERVEAGNLYVNRHTTGAIVGRQPFGGWKRSVIGPGAKAGGPNYVASLGRWSSPSGAPVDPGPDLSAAGELAGLRSEANVLRYRPGAGAGRAVREQSTSRTLHRHGNVTPVHPPAPLPPATCDLPGTPAQPFGKVVLDGSSSAPRGDAGSADAV